jgi:hypothetical protein
MPPSWSRQPLSSDRPPRFSRLEPEWLRAHYADGQHRPVNCEDIFVVDEGIISLDDRGM